MDDHSARIKEYMDLPDAVLDAIRQIENAGQEAYLVGGCVRDALLKRTVHDYDLATSATPEQMHAIFPTVIDTGSAFGGVTVVLKDMPLEITTFRIDQKSKDARHPEEVIYSKSIEEDVQRRDFTVNALVYHPQKGMMDFVHGMDDLKNGIIRTVGNASERFAEDHLRILRAVRFSAQLNFAIEEKTKEAILNDKKGLETVSRERIGSEIKKMMETDHPEKLSLLADADMLSFLGIPSKKDWNKLRNVPKAVRFAELCTLCGITPSTLQSALKRTNAEARQANRYLEIASRGLPKNKMDCKRLLAKYNPEEIQDGWSLLHTDILDAVQLLQQAIQLNEPCKLKDLKVCGMDLKEHGIADADIGEMLNQLLEMVLMDPTLNVKETLLNLIQQKKKEA